MKTDKIKSNFYPNLKQNNLIMVLLNRNINDVDGVGDLQKLGKMPEQYLE
jgi:hypothetical protein